jgi:hypothetical protein
MPGINQATAARQSFIAKRGDRFASKSGLSGLRATRVATAYDILRHCGVDLVKKNILGTPGRSLAD